MKKNKFFIPVIFIILAIAAVLLVISNNKQPEKFNTTAYNLKEIPFSFELLDNWQLENYDPEMPINQYRFTRMDTTPSPLLAISIYDQNPNVKSLDEMVTKRFGGAYFNSAENLQIGGLPAKTVSLNFIDPNNKSEASSIDLLVQIDNDTFLSLYGTNLQSQEQAQEIRFMQMSLANIE